MHGRMALCAARVLGSCVRKGYGFTVLLFASVTAVFAMGSTPAAPVGRFTAHIKTPFGICDARCAVRLAALPGAWAAPAVAQESGAASSRPLAAGDATRSDYLSRLIRRRDIGPAALLIGLAAAFGLGALHALSPGHGKTIVAAYLVGSRGTIRHALFLGAMVTFTHTASVFLLGLGTLFLSEYVVPDKIYPLLGTVSGLMIVGIGASLFYKRLQAMLHMHAHHHAHAHPHVPHGHHHDHGHAHHHGPGGHSHIPEGEVTLGSLVGLAVSGGLVPCPSALVLLLGSISIGRPGLGLVLLTAFSLGLAGVLIAIGVAVLYAKHLLPDSPRLSGNPLVKMMPVISAGIITCVGLVMTAIAAGWIRPGWY